MHAPSTSSTSSVTASATTSSSSKATSVTEGHRCLFTCTHSSPVVCDPRASFLKPDATLENPLHNKSSGGHTESVTRKQLVYFRACSQAASRLKGLLVTILHVFRMLLTCILQIHECEPSEPATDIGSDTSLHRAQERVGFLKKPEPFKQATRSPISCAVSVVVMQLAMQLQV